MMLALPSAATTIGVPLHTAGVLPTAGVKLNWATLQYVPAGNRVGRTSVPSVALLLIATNPAPSRQNATRFGSALIAKLLRPHVVVGVPAAA